MAAKGNRFKWTLTYFLEKAKEVHNDEFDYSLIQPEYMQGVKSKIPIKCKQCGNIFTPTIDKHIHSKIGCQNVHIHGIYRCF